MTLAKQTAFLKGIQSRKFETDKAKIYKILMNEPKTLQGLVLLGFAEKTSSARISDLMDLGLVRAYGQDNSFFKVVTDPNEQRLLMQTRKENTYQNWVKKGESMGFMRRYMMENIL
jgi:hypothetical protein